MKIVTVEKVDIKELFMRARDARTLTETRNESDKRIRGDMIYAESEARSIAAQGWFNTNHGSILSAIEKTARDGDDRLFLKTGLEPGIVDSLAGLVREFLEPMGYDVDRYDRRSSSILIKW